MKEKEIRNGKLTYENGILLVKFNEGAEVELQDIDEIHSEALRLSNGRPYCTVTDSRVNMTSNKEAREYASKGLYKENHLANAILVNSTAVRLMANFYIQFYKPPIPTKLFNSEIEAREWAGRFLKEVTSKN